MRSLIGAVLCCLAAGPALGQGGYAGQQSRDIKALSAQEQADLLAGLGMGMARAGELNHYPGPAHVLELKDKLTLTPGQATAVAASFERMAAAAKPLGAALVHEERELDAAFQAGSVNDRSFASRTARIAAMQGRLRAMHLRAHLEMRRVLTAQQIANYDTLRGYADGSPAAPARHTHPG